MKLWNSSSRLPRQWFKLWRGRSWGVLLACLAMNAPAEQVVISKIMYHPPGEKPEYIEVFNHTANAFDIAKWRFTGGVHYEFPDFNTNEPSASYLRPFERVVVSSANPEATRQAYTIPPAVRVFGPWTGKLKNDDERVTLADKNGIVICTVKYRSQGHWPIAAAGAGHALVLIDPDRRVDDWRNWTASPQPGGAPGAAPMPNATSPIPSPEIEATLGTVLTDYTAVWRYNDSGRNLGASWREPGFDDADWRQGLGLLGYDRKPLPEPGLRTRVNFGQQITYYFRLKFKYAGGAKPGDKVLFDQIIDDGVVYYLNGKEVGRSRMPEGPIGYLTQSSTTVPDATEETGELTLDPGLLLVGTNVLAAEVHQTKPTSSDIVFGLRLRLTPPPQPGLVINELFAAGSEAFIEFCNTATKPANLRGCYLSDSAKNLHQFTFSKDLPVPPNGLAAISLAECGISNTSPLSLYLTAPDGQTVLNAITVNISQDGRALGRRPDGGNAWFRFAEPSKDRPNPTFDVAMPPRLNEVHFHNNSIDWVEIINRQNAPLPMAGLFLASKRTLSDKAPLNPSAPTPAIIPPNGRVSCATQFALKDGEVRIYLADATGTILDARVFTPPKKGDTLQAFPEGSSEWYATPNHTRNAVNSTPRPSDIVINEIMYDPPYRAEGTEFVELLNRGSAPVDVSGWRLTEGVAFVFPPGSLIPPGGYRVAVGDQARFKQAYGEVPVAGEYVGHLRRGGEWLRLLDANDNLADEVDFKAGGDWPELAHGGGSSLELIHPWMDNARSSAWRDSDETKGTWKTFSCTNTYLEINPTGQPEDYRELHLFLAGAGHVALRNVGLWNNKVNFLDNPTRLSADGSSASGWLGQGTHWATFMTNGELHIVSDGRGDNKADRVEIDCVRLKRGETYELRFEGRWLSGSPRLIAQTWDRSLGSSFLLPLPARLGTPGQANSVSAKSLLDAKQAVPQVDDLAHQPPVPHSTDAVRISARIACAAPLASVRLFHRPDRATGDAPWASTPMHDDGRDGDIVAGDGIYAATLTQYRTNTQVVQFYVQAEAANGQAMTQPRLGAEWPAMFVVDDRKVRHDLRLDRFVVSAFDLDSMTEGNTAKHGFHHPRLSNHRYNMTFIANEEQVFYGGSIRISGSPFTRGNELGKGKWDLPEDRPFRGRTKFYFDNDSNYHNRLCRQLLYQMGHVTCQAEWIRVVINSSGAYMKEDTEPVTGEFLERNFANGNHGDLFRIDDEWWFADDWEYQNRDADWRYRGSDDPLRYRSEFQMKTHTTGDDYSPLISFIKIYSANQYTQEEIEKLLDAEAVLRLAAVRGYINDWDNFTMFRGKNGYFYRRADDGKFQFLQWDSDLAFRDVNYPFYGDRVAPWLTKPYNIKRFQNYLAQVAALSLSPRLAAWFEMEKAANPSRPPNTEFYLAFFQQRSRMAQGMSPPQPNRPAFNLPLLRLLRPGE